MVFIFYKHHTREKMRFGVRTKLRTFINTYKAKRKVATHGRMYVNYHSIFTQKVFVGDDCHFNGIEISGNGKVEIGDHFHSGKRCSIITHVHNYEGSQLPYDKVLINKDVKIGKNVWIGESVIILGGSIIEDGAIIQAGSVVVGTIPYCAIAGGHPAKPFKYRDIGHYESLLKEQ